MWQAHGDRLPPEADCVVHFDKVIHRTRCLGYAALGFRIVALIACFALLGSGFHLFTSGEPGQPPANVQENPPKTTNTTRDGIKPNIRVESRLFGDQTEQSILHVTVEDAPVSIGIIVDCSGSMQSKFEQSYRAVTEFLEAAHADDEFFLLLFCDRSALAVDFTNSREELLNGLSKVRAEGSTALLDAVYLALHRIRFGSAPRKALLLISDGGENSSRYTEREVKGFAQESDAQVFAIGIYKRVPSDPEEREAFSGRTLMTRLTEISGGFQYPVQDITSYRR
jgi:VWFA-related protein